MKKSKKIIDKNIQFKNISRLSFNQNNFQMNPHFYFNGINDGKKRDYIFEEPLKTRLNRQSNYQLPSHKDNKSEILKPKNIDYKI